jgi:hypothetical protein
MEFHFYDDGMELLPWLIIHFDIGKVSETAGANINVRQTRGKYKRKDQMKDMAQDQDKLQPFAQAPLLVEFCSP